MNWAKQKNKPTYSADEIIGLKDFKHTHTIDEIIGLREELETKGNDSNDSEDNSNDSNNGSNDSSDESTNGSVGENGQIIAKNGLKATQSGDDVIIGIDDSLSFILDGGTSSQFR